MGILVVEMTAGQVGVFGRNAQVRSDSLIRATRTSSTKATSLRKGKSLQVGRRSVIRHAALILVRKSFAWFLLAFVATPLVWSLPGAVLGTLWEGGRDFFLRVAVSVTILPIFAMAVVTLFSPFYLIVLLLWPRIVRYQPTLDSSRSHLFFACGLLAVPAAGVVGMFYAKAFGAFDLRELAATFSLALVSGWLGLLLPRLAFARLAPGTFASPRSPHAV